MFFLCLSPSFNPIGAVVCRIGSCPHQPAHAGQAWTPGPAGRGCRVGILGQGQGSREDSSMLPRHLKSSDGWERGPGSLREAQHLGPRDQESDPEAESQGGSGLLVGGGVETKSPRWGQLVMLKAPSDSVFARSPVGARATPPALLHCPHTENVRDGSHL